jgi:uncharacterized protein
MPDQKILDKIINVILQVIVPDKIILFGSQARGEARADSDYDFLIIKKDVDNILKTEQAIYRKLIGIKANVDIIIRTPELIEENKDIAGSLVKNALKDGILVYQS